MHVEFGFLWKHSFYIMCKLKSVLLILTSHVTYFLRSNIRCTVTRMLTGSYKLNTSAPSLCLFIFMCFVKKRNYIMFFITTCWVKSLVLWAHYNHTFTFLLILWGNHFTWRRTLHPRWVCSSSCSSLITSAVPWTPNFTMKKKQRWFKTLKKKYLLCIINTDQPLYHLLGRQRSTFSNRLLELQCHEDRNRKSYHMQ